MQPSSSARRCQCQSRSSRQGLALISTATPWAEACGENFIYIHLVTRPTQQLPSCHMAENRGERILHRADDAVCLGRTIKLEAAMNAGDHEIKSRQHLVGVIQGAIGENVGFDALEDMKVVAVASVQPIYNPVLLGNLAMLSPPA